MIVQIYEIQTPDEAAKMIELGVDHVGSVITSMENWRQETVRDAVQETQNLGGKSSLIPLFSDTETVFRALDYCQPDIVHFCEALPGTDDDLSWMEPLFRLQEKIKEKFAQIRIMRSIPIHVTGNGNLDHVLKLSGIFAPVSDYFLTDTLISEKGQAKDDQQPVNGFVGITGMTCDWGIASQLVLSSKIPVILAGGISPDNVAEGIINVRPFGVDSCTQTNEMDANGVPIRFSKDEMRVRQLVEETRRAERLLT